MTELERLEKRLAGAKIIAETGDPISAMMILNIEQEIKELKEKL